MKMTEMNGIANLKIQIWIRSTFALFGFAERWIDVIEFRGGLVRFQDPTVETIANWPPVTCWVNVDAIEKIRSITTADRIVCRREGCARSIVRRTYDDLYCGTWCRDHTSPRDGNRKR